MNKEDFAKRVAGSVYGLALGDAWGHPVEFIHTPEIIAKYGVRGPDLPERLIITDDTQMSLYLTRALEVFNTSAASYPFSRDQTRQFGTTVAEQFLIWLDDPDNNRAPGRNTISVLSYLKRRGAENYRETTNFDSKGCGANMRSAWLGLDMNIPDESLAHLSQIQSFVTHAHSTALVASAVTSLVTRDAVLGRITPGQFLDSALAWAHCFPHAAKETIDILTKAKNALKVIRERDISFVSRFNACFYVGEGWIAEEALAVACFLIDIGKDDEPYDSLRRVALTSGDSDSIGAIMGGLLGATGVQWNEHWTARIEPRYQDELDAAINYYCSTWKD